MFELFEIKAVYLESRIHRLFAPVRVTWNFEVVVGAHPGSVLSSLLSVIVMNAVAKDVRQSLSFEMLSARPPTICY